MYINFTEFSEFLKLWSVLWIHSNVEETKIIYSKLRNITTSPIKTKHAKEFSFKDYSKEFIEIVQDKVKDNYNISLKNKSYKNSPLKPKINTKISNEEKDNEFRKSIGYVINSFHMWEDNDHSEENSFNAIHHSSLKLFPILPKTIAEQN